MKLVVSYWQGWTRRQQDRMLLNSVLDLYIYCHCTRSLTFRPTLRGLAPHHDAALPPPQCPPRFKIALQTDRTSVLVVLCLLLRDSSRTCFLPVVGILRDLRHEPFPIFGCSATVRCRWMLSAKHRPQQATTTQPGAPSLSSTK